MILHFHHTCFKPILIFQLKKVWFCFTDHLFIILHSSSNEFNNLSTARFKKYYLNIIGKAFRWTNGIGCHWESQWTKKFQYQFIWMRFSRKWMSRDKLTMESKTIRIKTLTSISCSVRFEVFSCDSCFAVKNSGLLQIEIKVFSRFHRVCLLNSTIATCFRRIQAKFDRFYSNFRQQRPLPCAHIRHAEFRSHTLHTQ